MKLNYFLILAFVVFMSLAFASASEPVANDSGSIGLTYGEGGEIDVDGDPEIDVDEPDDESNGGSGGGNGGGSGGGGGSGSDSSVTTNDNTINGNEGNGGDFQPLEDTNSDMSS